MSLNLFHNAKSTKIDTIFTVFFALRFCMLRIDFFMLTTIKITQWL